jgi:hypothetical protein
MHVHMHRYLSSVNLDNDNAIVPLRCVLVDMCCGSSGQFMVRARVGRFSFMSSVHILGNSLVTRVSSAPIIANTII